MYSKLKYEGGVHRVQRVPLTESGGRVHTSTATVAVMPEVDEVDVQIDPKVAHIHNNCICRYRMPGFTTAKDPEGMLLVKLFIVIDRRDCYP